MDKAALRDRQGSHAGRGFRYQDAIAVWLALRIWAGVDPPGLIIPEGGDDIERKTALGCSLVQVKSLRAHLNRFSTASVQKHIKELWERQHKADPTPIGLELVLEREIVGRDAVDGEIPIDGPLASALSSKRYSGLLLAKTKILHASEPAEASITLISDRIGCAPLAAQMCFARLLIEVGALADQNGVLGPTNYRGLSNIDTDRIIAQTLATIDLTQIEQAVRDGACEPVDFLTPLNDPEFYLGVDVQPGHIVAGLATPRLEPRDALTRGLETRGAALIAGPSGSGKSAIMWDTAHALRHTIRWHRLIRLDPNDMASLRRLLQAYRTRPESPVGFIVDDIGRRGAAVWDELTREFAAIPGALLLGSIREEDLFLLEGRARAVEVRAEPDPELAQRLFDELRKSGRTSWSGWREPWRLSHGLVMEYAHILTAGRRLHETLAEQLDARLRDPGRSLELSMLRATAFAGAAGAVVEASRLASALGVGENDVARSLRRLLDEHLLREDGEGRLTGLHQLRSAELLRLTHDGPLPQIGDTFAQAVQIVAAHDLEPLTAHAIQACGVAIPVAIHALAARLTREPDIHGASAALRGLGAARIARAVDEWLASPAVEALPRTQVGTAAFWSFTESSILAFADRNPQMTAAAVDFAAIRSKAESDPRNALFDALPTGVLSSMVAVAYASTLDRFLSAQIGMSLHPKMADALDDWPRDPLNGPLESVAGLLGVLAEIDRSRAISWVDEIGEESLVSRLPREIPWASEPSFEQADDGRVIRCDLHYIYGLAQKNPHDDVVRLCELALALSPRSDIVASSALAPNGQPAGTSIMSLAQKRISRENLPTAALQAWNRRWRDAVALRVAAPSYTDYLTRAVDLLNRLIPALKNSIDAHLRLKKPSQCFHETLVAVREKSQALTPPAVAAREVADVGSTQVNRAVTGLQDIIFYASFDVVMNFATLPCGVGVYIVRLHDLISQIDKAERDEPWTLVGGPPPSLAQLREDLTALLAISGELKASQASSAVRWAKAVHKSARGNALRVAGALAEQRASAARSKLGADLNRRLAEAGVRADIHVRADQKEIQHWPPCQVLALLPMQDFMDLGAAWLASDIMREHLPETIRLTVMPTINGHTLSGYARSGFRSLLPLADEAEDWGHRLVLPRFNATLSPLFDSAANLASGLQSMDRLSLGIAGRPLAEIDARHQFESDLIKNQEAFNLRAAQICPELIQEAEEILKQIRIGDLPHADAVHEAMHGGASGALEKHVFFRIALDQAEFDKRSDDGASR